MRKIIIIAIIIIAAAAFTAAAVFLRMQEKGTSVAYVDNDSISRAEYAFYLTRMKAVFEDIGGPEVWEMDFDGETAQSVAKRRALENILLVKQIKEQARKLDLKLTDDEKKSAGQSAEDYYSEIESDFADENGITLGTLKTVMQEYVIFGKVYELLTENYEADEAEIEALTEEYFEQPDTEETPEIRETIMAYYRSQKKQDYFTAECAKWLEASNVRINYEVWDKVNMP